MPSERQLRTASARVIAAMTMSITTPQTIVERPLSPTIGAEIHGIDLRDRHLGGVHVHLVRAWPAALLPRLPTAKPAACSSGLSPGCSPGRCLPLTSMASPASPWAVNSTLPPGPHLPGKSIDPLILTV